MFLYSMPVAIRKAKTRRKVTRTYVLTSKLSKLMATAIHMHFARGLKTFKRSLNANEIAEAVRTGGIGNIQRLIPWPKLDDHLAPLQKLLAKVAGGASKVTVDGMPQKVKSSLHFDWRNPAIRYWVKNRTGELIVGIQSDTQKVVQRAVMRSFTHALTPRQVAEEIKNSIGLYPRQQDALVNYRSGLQQNKTLTPDRVDTLVDKYSDRLLDQRAMTIARTETRFATNQGQLDVWSEAANQGLVNRNTAKKIYIVDGNPCDICEPMDGIAVPLEEQFTTPEGEAVDGPPIHPNCMCGLEFEF